MRVLLPYIYHDLTHCIERAFQDEGHETLVVDWRKFGKESNRHKIEPYCLAAAKEFQPEFAFCQFQDRGLITHKFPEYLKSIGCFSVNWSGDVRHPLPDWYKDLAPYFSITSFTNVPDVEEIRAMGYRAEFLQIGYDETIFNTDGAGERSGVVFLGNNYSGYRFAESEGRREMVAALAKAFPDDFTVYGMSWEGIVPPKNNGGYLHETMSAPVLKKALVSCGWDHFHRPGFASDRILRGTACGCAVVNQFYEGIEEEHPNVYHAPNIAGMVDKVYFLLNQPDRAILQGKVNAANTLMEHRWNNRVKQMMQWMS